MEVRIGVVHTPKEISVEVEISPEEIQQLVAAALSDDDGVLWIADTRGRLIGVPGERIAYVELEIEGAAKRVGFGRA